MLGSSLLEELGLRVRASASVLCKRSWAFVDVSLDLGRQYVTIKDMHFILHIYKDGLHLHAEQRIKGCSPQFRFDSGQCASPRRASNA